MDLILASGSASRRTLLGRLDVPFRCVSPPIDEEAVKATLTGLGPRELAEALALAKGRSVACDFPGAAVVAGDQLAAIDGMILGKPGTTKNAEDQLQTLAGRTHELITAIVVLHQGRTYAHTDITRLALRNLTPIEIARYVAKDVPLDCSGSYKLESHGITLFDRIESADQSAIIGIPLIALTTILRDLGFAIP